MDKTFQKEPIPANCRARTMRRVGAESSETTPVKRSRCCTPEATPDVPPVIPRYSPRRQRIEVRDQEKASIVNCVAIQSSSGFRDLSLCDKAAFTACQDGKQGGQLPVPTTTPLQGGQLPVPTTTPLQKDVVGQPFLRVSARNSSSLIPQSTEMLTHIPPETSGNGVPRTLSNEMSLSESLSGDLRAGSLGSEASYNEIKGYNAVATVVKNPMRPTSSRGGHSSSLSMRRPFSRAASFPDLAVREAMAKNSADLKHSREKLDAYTKHTAALERVCREAGLSVPTLTLPLPPGLSSLPSSSFHQRHSPPGSAGYSARALTRGGFSLPRGPSLGSTSSAIHDAPDASPSAELFTIRPPSETSSEALIQPPSDAPHADNLMAGFHAPVHTGSTRKGQYGA